MRLLSLRCPTCPALFAGQLNICPLGRHGQVCVHCGLREEGQGGLPARMGNIPIPGALSHPDSAGKVAATSPFRVLRHALTL